MTLLELLYAAALGVLLVHAVTSCVLAKIRSWRPQRRVSTLHHRPKVALVVPAYNESLSIERVLERARASTYPLAAILVVDDGSSDDTAKCAERALTGFAGGVVFRLPENRGKAAALNHALVGCSAEVLFTLDADTYLEPDTIERAVHLMAASSATAVACNLRVAHRDSFLHRLQALEYVGFLNLDRRAQALIGAITTVPGAAAAWRRSTIARLGGFPGRTLTEDTDASLSLLRRRHRIVMADTAVSRTEAPQDLDQLLIQRERWFWGNLACAHYHLRAESEETPPFFRLLVLPVFVFLSVASMPLYALVLQGDLRIALGGGLLALIAGVSRILIGSAIDGQPAPRLGPLLACVLFMPLIVCLAAAIGLARRLLHATTRW
jgi:peptidoglycan-N-acetylglucosamine deacetylase